MSSLFNCLVNYEYSPLSTDPESIQQNRSCSLLAQDNLIIKFFDKASELATGFSEYLKNQPDTSKWSKMSDKFYPNGQEDLNAIEEAVTQNPGLLANGWEIEDKTVLKLLKKNGLLLAHAPAHLQANPEYIKAACNQNLSALSYACEEETVRTIVQEKVKENPEVINLIPNHLFNEISKEFLLKNPDFQNEEIMKRILLRNGNLLNFVPQKFQREAELVNITYSKSKQALRFADRAMVLEIVGKDGLALEFAGSEHQKDPEIIRKAFAQNPRAIQHAKDPATVESLIQEATTQTQKEVLALLPENLVPERFLGALKEIQKKEDFHEGWN